MFYRKIIQRSKGNLWSVNLKPYYFFFKQEILNKIWALNLLNFIYLLDFL